MAGWVKTAMQSSMERSILHVMPYDCPVASKPGQRNHCLAADLHSSHVNLCPFLVRFRLQVVGSSHEVTTVDAMLRWLATQETHGGQWISLCLRRESADTDAGARLRP